jgi:hypothetical protein
LGVAQTTVREHRPGRSGQSGEAAQLAKELPGEPGGLLLDAAAGEHRAERRPPRVCWRAALRAGGTFQRRRGGKGLLMELASTQFDVPGASCFPDLSRARA